MDYSIGDEVVYLFDGVERTGVIESINDTTAQICMLNGS
jgi:hypothetical protein